MRINSDRPIEIIKRLVTDHLVTIWPHPDDMAWMQDPSAPVAVARIYADAQLSVPIATNGWRKRVICGSKHQEPAITIVAGFGVGASDEAMLLLAENMEPVMAMHTDASVRDNVVRIKGAEIGIVLVPATVLQKRPHRGIVPGSTSLHWFRIERLGANGWEPAAGEAITIPASALPTEFDPS